MTNICSFWKFKSINLMTFQSIHNNVCDLIFFPICSVILIPSHIEYSIVFLDYFYDRFKHIYTCNWYFLHTLLVKNYF